MRGVGALSAAFSAGAVIGFYKRVAAAIAELAEKMIGLSDVTGVSTTALQQWFFAASQTNVKAQDAETGIVKLTEKLGEAREGTTASAKAFKHWGVAIADANGNALDTERVLDNVANAMAAITDPGQRAAMAVDLFGKKGARLIPMLKDGAGAMRALMANAEIVSPEQLANIDRLDDAWTRLKTSVLSDGGALIGTLVRIGDAFGQMAGLSSSAGAAIERAFAGLVANQLFANLPTLLKVINKLLPDAVEPDVVDPYRGNPRASQADRDAADAAREEHATAGMTDEEKLERERGKFARLQHEREKIDKREQGLARIMGTEFNPEGSQAQVRNTTAQIESAKRIEELERQIAGRSKPEAAKGKGLEIKSDSATSVGAFIGGMSPGLVSLTLGQRQLTQQELAAKFLGQAVEVLRRIENKDAASGAFE
jgi:hypothetical protein